VVQHLGGEVSAEDTPHGAIGGRADVALVAGEDFGGGESLGVVGEEGTVLDEGLAGEGAISRR